MKKLLSIILVGVLLLSVMPFTVFAQDVVTEITVNETYSFRMDDPNYMFKFTPNEDGNYRFASDNTVLKIYASLFDSNGFTIYSYGSEYNMNFNFTNYLYAGKTYYLGVGSFDGGFDFPDHAPLVEIKIYKTAGINESNTGRTQIMFNEEHRITTNMNGREYYLIPSSDGWYRFRSWGDEHYAYAILYDSDGNELCRSDQDSGVNYNFTYYLKADTVYYLKVGAYIGEDRDGTFKFWVSKVTEPDNNKGNESDYDYVTVVKAEITTPPTNTTCVRGFERETVDLTNMEATITLSNGKKYIWAYDKDIDLDFNRTVKFSLFYDDKGYFVRIICERATDVFYFNTIEQGNTVEASNIKLCDIDGDDCISVMDASVVQRNIAKIETLENRQYASNGDYVVSNGNNEYSTNIQRYAAKLI